MRRLLPLIALLAVGCGSGSTASDSAATTPAPAAASSTAATTAAPAGSVDSTKPFAQRGEK